MGIGTLAVFGGHAVTRQRFTRVKTAPKESSRLCDQHIVRGVPAQRQQNTASGRTPSIAQRASHVLGDGEQKTK